MKITLLFLNRIALAGAAISVLTACNEKKENMKAPVADKIDKQLTAHGDTRIDPYYWMNDREDPRVLEYLEAENAYTTAMLKHTEALQEKIYEEITSRIDQTDESVPYFYNGYFYYRKYEEGKEYPVYCRKKGSLENPEEIMLDVNVMAEGHDFFSVAGMNVSPDNRLLAYGVDTVSRRQYTLHIKDLLSGEIFTDKIPNTTGSVAWAADNKTFFYTAKDETTLRPDRIFRHILMAGMEDELVYQEEDETFTTYAYNSKSREYVLIGSFSTLSTEYRFLEANNPTGQFRLLQKRMKDLEYYPSHYEGWFYLRTNLDARNFRLMRTSVKSPSLENWEEVIPHRDDVLLEDFEVFRSYLTVNERFDGLTHIRIIGWENGEDYFLEFDDPAYMAYFSVNPEFDTDVLRYGYTSLTVPNSIYDFNMKTKVRTLKKQEKVIGGYDPAEYRSERLKVEADDGTLVPVSLVYKTGTPVDGTSPLLLVGYGSYGSSYDPGFSSARLSLLDRGFIYAIAHVRGGEEMGRQWYEDGKLLKKKNTFTDFIDCAEFLVENEYSAPDKLFAMGGSAGGLLMGAIINIRPELFKGIVAAVPFVDVVTTMLDESIPLTTGEYDEWGNPNEKEYYDYMLSYSPYDNVTNQKYPNMLVTTGWHDSQVQYWEPAKWVAKLRDMKTGDNVLLLWTNLEYGHGGASGRFKRYREVAMEYAFILDLNGIKQ